MDAEKLKEMLEKVGRGEIQPGEALERLMTLPYEDLDFARLDTHRDLRRGFPEVVLCEGKTIEQVTGIFSRFAGKSDLVMGSRASPEMYAAVERVLPQAHYYPEARIILCGSPRVPRTDKMLLVMSAGSSDIPVAEEAAVTAEIMGNVVERVYDVGVAGLHRLLSRLETIRRANVIVVVAGMEGALPSVVSGLVKRPVIAVPTSIGYGANFGGLSALLGMLNTCSPGVSVVNIDNGFGAAYTASLINKEHES